MRFGLVTYVNVSQLYHIQSLLIKRYAVLLNPQGGFGKEIHFLSILCIDILSQKLHFDLFCKISYLDNR